MQRRRHYSLAYLLVLLAAVGGFFVVRERASTVAMPQIAVPDSVQQVAAGLDLLSLFTRLMPAVVPAAQPTAASPASTAQPAIVEGIEPTETPASGAAAPQPAAATPTPDLGAPAQAADTPFVLAGPVRHNSDDCSAAAIRGTVRDAAGSPLAGVRLWRYDQLGNEEVIETQAGDADRGEYSFALDDTANSHYVQVIDAGGAIISPVIEIQHRQGEAPDALCHWVDWLQR